MKYINLFLLLAFLNLKLFVFSTENNFLVNNTNNTFSATLNHYKYKCVHWEGKYCDKQELSEDVSDNFGNIPPKSQFPANRKQFNALKIKSFSICDPIVAGQATTNCRVTTFGGTDLSTKSAEFVIAPNKVVEINVWH